MPLIIIPSFVPVAFLQRSMIMLGLYLLYRVFAIETLVAQDLQFKTRYNFFLGITDGLIFANLLTKKTRNH